MRKIIIITIGMLLGTFLQAQSINTESSKVKFSASNMKWMTVEGTFTGMNGEVNFNEQDPSSSSFNVCVDAATVNTENEARDKHLRNEDFFEVETYPQICFRSTSVTKTSRGYSTSGTLEMHGVSKDVTIDFSHDSGTFTGKLKIKRLEYGVGATTGTFMVGDEIKIEIIAVSN